MRYVLILLSISIITLTSCDDLLTKELSLEDVGYEKQLVINATFSSLDSGVGISVTENTSLANTKPTQYKLIDGVQLEMYVDDQPIEVIPDTRNELINFQVRFSNPQDLIGKPIKIVAKHPDYPTAEATTTIPPAPKVKDFEYELEATSVPFETERFNRLSFTIEDNLDEENYYAVSISPYIYRDTFINGPDTSIIESHAQYGLHSNDPNLELVSGQFLISDKAFAGKEHKTQIAAKPWLPRGGNVDSVTVIVRHISKEYFLFEQSLERQRRASDVGFFSEPVTLYSNVVNGLGITKSFNQETYVVRE